MGRGKEKRSDKVACNLCNRRFKTDNDLQAHVQNKHLQDPRAVESLSNHLGTRLQIVLEDDWIAVVVKPQGCPTFGKGSFAKSWLLAQLVPSQASDALSKARPAHRLDAPTGGLMVLAKSKSSIGQLSEAFAQGLVKKRYRALVRGNYALGSSGECKEPLYGKPCTTRFQAMEEPVETQEGPVSTLDLWPQHGRRHQLRRHMAMLGSPIVRPMVQQMEAIIEVIGGMAVHRVRMQRPSLRMLMMLRKRGTLECYISGPWKSPSHILINEWMRREPSEPSCQSLRCSQTSGGHVDDQSWS